MQDPTSLKAAIDVGGTKTLIELFRGQGNGSSIASESERLWTPTGKPVLAPIIDAVLRLAGGRSITGVALGSPGPVDVVNGVILTPPNLARTWWDLEVVSELGRMLDADVALENDCNLGALGEATHGADRTCDSLLYVTVSTGVGAGLIVNGQIFSGWRGLAGELGHTVATERRVPCSCGRNGCVEAVASGTALARRACETGWHPPNEESVTAQHITEAAEAGDEAAGELLQEAAVYLGRAIVNFLYAYDPEVIILGGGVAQSDMFFKVVREAVKSEPKMSAFEERLVKRAELADSSVIAGARVLAEKVSEGLS